MATTRKLRRSVEGINRMYREVQAPGQIRVLSHLHRSMRRGPDAMQQVLEDRIKGHGNPHRKAKVVKSTKPHGRVRRIT